MKETRFIEQNKDGWKEFDELMKARKKDPDKLSELFLRLTDDLSYARTFYPRRSVRVFLNNQAQRVFVSIYRNKRFKGSRFMEFWRTELPNITWHSRKEMALSLIMTLLFIIIGVFSSIHDTDFARVILGDSYIRMTESNIASGDPMAVYKGDNELTMFLGITINNLRVDLMAFVMGVFFGLGTVWILLQNGVMIGAFQYFFIERGLFWPSFLTIFQHGTLEISAMVISGAAGLALGRGLLFPGTYTRLQAFQQGALRALKLFLGVVPITIMAGFIEGFITRHTAVPGIIRVAVILLSFGFIIFYYILLPWRRHGSAPQPPELRPDSSAPIAAFVVRSTGEIFSSAFGLIRRILRPVLIHAGCVAAVLTFAFLLDESLLEGMSLNWLYFPQSTEGALAGVFNTAANIVQTLRFDVFPQQAVLIGMAFLTTMMLVLRQSQRILHRDDPNVMPPTATRIFLSRQAFNMLLLTAMLTGIGILPGAAGRLLFFCLLPVFLLWTVTTFMGGKNLYEGLVSTFHYTAQRIGRVYGLYIVMFLLSAILIGAVTSPLTLVYLDLVKAFLPEQVAASGMVFVAGYFFLLFFMLDLVLVLLLTGTVFLHFSFREISEAVSLRGRIQSMTERR